MVRQFLPGHFFLRSSAVLNAGCSLAVIYLLILFVWLAPLLSVFCEPTTAHDVHRAAQIGLLAVAAMALLASVRRWREIQGPSRPVIVLLVFMHAREGGTRPSLLTLSTGLLVGGALGNLVDRLANGFVFDFIDIGIGSTRFWTFNVADMAITSGIALLVAQAAFGGVRNRVRAPHG